MSANCEIDAVVHEQPVLVSERVAVRLLDRRTAGSAHVREEQRTPHGAADLAQVLVVPRRLDAAEDGGRRSATRILGIPPESEAVTVDRLGAERRVQRHRDDGVLRVEDERGGLQRLPGVGQPTAHVPPALRAGTAPNAGAARSWSHRTATPANGQDRWSAGIRDRLSPASGPCHAGAHGCHRELEGHRRRRGERRIEHRVRGAHPRIRSPRRAVRHRDGEGRGRGARPRPRHAVHRIERHHRRQRHLGRRGLARRRDHGRSEAESRTDPHRARRRQRPHPEVDDAAAARGARRMRSTSS